MSKKNFGLLCGGGVAPGLNAAVAKAAETAASHGAQIVAFIDGFEGMRDGQAVLLTPEMVENLQYQGGTAIGTSRFNPNDEQRAQMIAQLQKWGLSGGIVIGGDDTNTSGLRFSLAGFPIVGVVKTIDNDVPGTDYCFGFDTVVALTAMMLKGMRLDTQSQALVATYIVNIMGRTCGRWALEAGKAGEATVILIPEMFSLAGLRQMMDINSPSLAVRRDALLERIARVLEIEGESFIAVSDLRRIAESDRYADKMIKVDPASLASELAKIAIAGARRKVPIKHMVVAMGEGLVNKLPVKPVAYGEDMDPTRYKVSKLLTPEREQAGETIEIGIDAHGHPRIADVDLATPLMNLVVREAREGGQKIGAKAVQIGYIVRGADPCPRDINIAGGMARKAVLALLDGQTGVMVGADGAGDLKLVRYDSLPKDASGHLIPRLVDCDKNFMEAMDDQAF